MPTDAARYLSYSGRDPCWGCSRALQAWHEGDRAGPMPPRAQRATWRRVRGGVEWPLCGLHKALWEAVWSGRCVGCIRRCGRRTIRRRAGDRPGLDKTARWPAGYPS